MLKVKHELIIGAISILLTIFYIGYIVAQYNGSSSKRSSASVQKLTLADVQKHNTPADCWIVIQKNIYEVTSYLSLHPGGKERIIPYCGKDDATQAFTTQDGEGSHSKEANDLLQSFFVGGL